MPAKKSKTKKVPAQKEILTELKKTGTLLKANFLAAKKSSQIKNVEKAFGTTMNTLIVELNKLVAEAKKMKVDETIKKGLSVGIKEINKDLNKSLKTWK